MSGKNLQALCKEFCIRCRNENISEWDRSDDEFWNRGFIHCPDEYVGTDEFPSSNCPYRLEHMMATQKNPVVVVGMRNF